jgi:cell fate regulator YaaT (PSP1 superfamily)
MGCGSCGTGGSSPKGCKSNGGCSTGGCNRMNAYDWLVNLPFSNQQEDCRIIEVSFNKGSRKDFVYNPNLQQYCKGDLLAIEGISGFDVGEVCLTGEVVRLQLKKNGVKEATTEFKKILRRATDRDLEIMRTQKAREADILIRSRAIAKQLNLSMKISEVEIQADGKKATFFYIADDRVDFRGVIKVYAAEFKVRVEMRQIGARQEAAKVGGIGSCGRELCCSSWLSDFKSVNTTAARYQNLSINQSKLSGQCGRLKCCLNYELDTYLDELSHFPSDADSLKVQNGYANLVKKDVFKNIMWYVLPDSYKQYPLTIERVIEIKKMNRRGEVPEELGIADISSSKAKNEEPAFVELVGQINLKTLERNSKKRKDKERKERQQQQRPQQRPQQQTQGNNPNNNRGNNPQQQPRNPQQGQGQGGGNKPNQSRPNVSGQPKQQARNQQQGQQGQHGGSNRPNNPNQQRPNNNGPRKPFDNRNKGGNNNPSPKQPE